MSFHDPCYAGAVGGTPTTPALQSKIAPFGSAQAGTEIISGPLKFRYEFNNAGGHIQVAATSGSVPLWYESSSNGIGYSGPMLIEGALDLTATGAWANLGGNAPVAIARRLVKMVVVSAVGMWELRLANADGNTVLLTVVKTA